MKRLLIIEDDTLIRENYCEIFAEEGFEVRSASCGKNGIEILEFFLPDLIICDIMMPGMDGFKVKDILSKNKSTSSIPFIYLTARTNIEDVQRAMELGADDYITKPVSADKLLELVSKRLLRIDESTRQSEARLNRAELISKSGSWELYIASKSIIASNGAQKIYGLANDRIDYEIVKNITSPEYRQLIDNGFKFLIENNRPFNVEYKIRTVDTGEVKVIHAIAEYDKEKKVILGVIQDITERKIAEDALRESESRFHDLVDNAPLPVAIVSLETGRYLYMNIKGTELMGLGSTDDYKNYSSEDRYANPKQRSNIIETLKKEGHISNFEIELKDLNGKYVTALVSSLITNFENKPALFITFLDITERKHSEVEIRKLYTAVEQSPVSIVITDINGNIEYVNPKFTEISGYNFEEVHHQNPRILKSGEQTREYYKNLWDTISSGKVWRGNFHNKKKNGELYWESATISPILDEQGAVTNFIAVKEDITVKIITEENLVKEKELLQALLDNIPDLIYFKDKDSKFTRINKAEALVLGVSDPREAIAKSDFDFFETGHAKVAREDEQKIMQSNIPLIAKLENIRTAGGERRWFTATKVPVINKQGVSTGLVGISRDITSAKLNEEKLEKYSEGLKELYAGKEKLFTIIAHDLKSPFSPLLGLSETIVNEFDSLTPGELKLFNTEIFNALKNSYTLLENLLSWSRLETGQMKLNPTSINIFDQTVKVISILSGNAKLKNISLVNATDNNVFISADPNMFHSVLQNLISNAIKFTNKNGLIKISTETVSNDLIQITVSDNGVGMKSEQTKKLFSITAASTYGTNNEKGTGLGLMICKEMVERQGGTISVKSEVGKGTDIIFTLPKAV